MELFCCVSSQSSIRASNVRSQGLKDSNYQSEDESFDGRRQSNASLKKSSNSAQNCIDTHSIAHA